MWLLSDKSPISRLLPILKKFMKFLGPGIMISVAYMDPGNYSTAVAAGSAYKYNLLFSILLSNCLAVFLQVLAAKLGAVTGLDLAANCKTNLPHRLNLFIYALAELAIIATDLAEVVGTAIALNIIFKLPLFFGVIVTVVDVLIVLMAYKPNGPLLFIRIFESFVSILVGATVVCFAIELYQVSHDSSVNFSTLEVLRGFLPNADVVDMSEREGGNGLFLSLAILGATVMPHSLYLGSGLVQSRLKDFDIKHGYYLPKYLAGDKLKNDDLTNTTTTDEESDSAHLLPQAASSTTTTSNNFRGNNQVEYRKNDVLQSMDSNVTKNDEDEEEEDDCYRPSIHAIDDTMTYTIVELVISLFTVALFVNSAILIVAGATLQSNKNKHDDHKWFIRDDDGHESDSDDDDYANADLFTIYHLLSTHLSPTAGFVFALALLCSGQSAGVVCTLAGQMVSEGFLSWSLPPVTRRLITRGLAIIPCLVVVSFAGREGLSRVLNTSQVVLSILLPFVSAPLIYFTCSKSIMRVPILVRDGDELIDSLLDAESGISTIISDNDDTHIEEGSVETRVVSNKKKAKKNVDSLRFKTTEPAIRLQNLRNSHPCASWDDDDEFMQQQGLSLDIDNNKDGPRYLENSNSMLSSNNPSDADIEDGDDDNNDTTHVDNRNSLDLEVDMDMDIYRVKGYKDMSNGPLMRMLAYFIWGFITSLNLFLIGSMLLGYDVPL